MNPIALAAVLFLFLSSACVEASVHCSEDDQREGVSSVKLDRVMPPYASVYLLLVTALVSSVILGTAFAQETQRIGPPTQFFVDSERYRFASPDLSDSNFYPIPNDRITRATYMRYLESRNLEALAANPNHGEGGPRAFLPILAKYVESGDARWADACIAMLKRYRRARRARRMGF